MATQQNMEHLIEIIKKMSIKIDNLENKINELTQKMQNNNYGILPKNNTINVVPNYTPSIGFQTWLQNLSIDKNDVMVLFGTNILDGFKCYLIKHLDLYKNNTISRPLWISNNGRYKQIYIYDINDNIEKDLKWHIMTDEDTCLLVDIIWRKMIEYYFVTEEECIDTFTDDEQTQRDFNKKILLDMKKRLIQKYTKDIQRCIIGIFG